MSSDLDLGQQAIQKQMLLVSIYRVGITWHGSSLLKKGKGEIFEVLIKKCKKVIRLRLLRSGHNNFTWIKVGPNNPTLFLKT